MDEFRLQALERVASEALQWAEELGVWFYPAQGELEEELNQLEQEHRSLAAILRARLRRGRVPSSTISEPVPSKKDRADFLRDRAISDHQKLEEVIRWHSTDENPVRLKKEFGGRYDRLIALALEEFALQKELTLNSLQRLIQEAVSQSEVT